MTHEILGHVTMLLNPEVANFSQEIGLASLDASDRVIILFHLAKMISKFIFSALVKKYKSKNIASSHSQKPATLTRQFHIKASFHPNPSL